MEEGWYLDSLAAVPLFSGCTRAELAVLGRHGALVRHEAGAILCKEDEHGDEFFLLLDGAAEVTVRGRVVDRIGPGEHFGELAVLDPAPRDATVSATTAVELLVLDHRGFRAAMREVPVLAERVVVALVRRVRQSDLQRPWSR